MRRKPLIPNFTTIVRDDFSDFYVIMAKNIEDALMTARAEPGKDYTILDLFRLAQPFVVEQWKDRQHPLEFSLTWPAGKSD